MHFDPLNTLSGRHLALAYALVFIIQGGYLGSILYKWRSLRRLGR